MRDRKWWWSANGWLQSTKPWTGTNNTVSAFFFIKVLWAFLAITARYPPNQFMHLTESTAFDDLFDRRREPFFITALQLGTLIGVGMGNPSQLNREK